MTTKEAVQKVNRRFGTARLICDGAQKEMCVLKALREALEIGSSPQDNLAIILDVLQEDES